MRRFLATVFVAALLIVTTATVLAVVVGHATAPRLSPTASGTVDQTNKTDVLKATPPALVVVSECRSA